MSLRRVNPQATFKIVSQHDPALLNETEAELDSGNVDASGNKVLNQSRYEKFLQTFDVGDLKFKEGETPTFIIIRCLTHEERALLDEKYMEVNVVTKSISYRKRLELFVEMFKMAALQIEEGGVVTKLTDGMLDYYIAVEVGNLIQLASIVGKNTKKA